MATCEGASEGAPLTCGEAVRAFYHMNDHPHGYRYVRLLDGPPEKVPEDRAAVGLSTGWIPATVAEDWRPGGEQAGGERRVLVRLHGHFADAYNQDPEPVNGMYWRVPRSHVRPMGSPQPAELSLLVVRWWDYWNRNNRRSRSHNVANEEMILDVLAAPHAMFGERGSYEVHSAFIRNSSDLASIGQPVAASMRGKCKAGLYFLWPVQRLAAERRLAGSVSEPVLLELMARMEAAGVPSRWPHSLGLYRELAGKTWVPRMSERPDLCVPPTVRLDMAKWATDPHSAAEGALEELGRLRKSLPGGGREPAGSSPVRGVAKLGFSWMGEDVRPFTGVEELTKVLGHFLDGAQQDAVCLVQERIENVVCELRFVCCQDLAQGPDALAREVVWMKLHPPRHNDETFSLTSHQTMTPREAADYAFFGSMEAVEAAEKKATQLVELWLQWFRDEGHEVPAACRLDFLVAAARPAGGRGQPEVSVYTVELCECGGSLCGLQPQCRAVACLNACLFSGQGGGHGQGLSPQPLPPLRPPAYEGEGGGGGGGGGGGAARGGAARGGRTPGRGRREAAGTLAKPAHRSSAGAKLALLAALVLLFLRFWRRR